MKLAVNAMIFCLAATVPAHAEDADGIVSLDILDGGLTPDGTYIGAIRLSLADGWKTYWRAPGDAGIPPQFDWKGSGNVADVSITWPSPHVFDQNGVRSIGYKDQLVLPVEITPKNPAKSVRLQGTMDLGVCKDVCVPRVLDFDHTLD
ncbi:MAG: protein-disulfide reductase DsbD domain-containing protein, partial [Ruegeria sp.]